MNSNNKYKIGQILDNIKIGDLSYEARGEYRDENNHLILIDNALPEEIVKIQITHTFSKYSIAKVLKRHKDSQIRIQNNDESYIGAAPLSIISYEEQLNFKLRTINNLFKRNLDITIDSITESPKQLSYRNKITLFPKLLNNNKMALGIKDKNLNEIIIPNEYLLANVNIQKFIKFLNKKINENFDLFEIFNSCSNIILRSSNIDNKLQITINLNKEIRNINRKIKSLNVINEYNYSIIINNTKRQKITIGNDENIASIDNYKFIMNNDSFFQINEDLTPVLYKSLLDKLDLNENQIIVDAYCGIGTITLYLAQKSKKVYGLEIIPNAIKNAKQNSIINKVSNAEFIVGDVSKTISNINEKIDVVVVDPPRIGLDKNFINSIIKISPNEIGYISCNPRTLCRDLKIFKEHGYEIKYIQGFDMFPQTYHIEMVCVLYKK
ncbi:23S rRNA (uracil(1939)-C(5))-methyltransferase RlmD [Mycoplasma sp. Mirounga ES2805-ORL]|uniref:23S rRNA (uracil(1939)-C(5))-methyltransferase RlmD n=1 Tax=Mycoplasma sp. Mirounga ES2805-ORL TaxID=754514 RepID=UPI00197BDECA|nr:23S rRNA (uracil(1939)-C(5))-methyltransferase RlmD [Mycoplasma sp. Mirounga ES2805-ORL]QSF13467.1 23S rRNA (uracil(1939)-C(5))-methyltransferase RlmD [Mycoplasma sp. Mirounga ES2805-ORL]